MKYDKDNYNLLYHDTEESIKYQSGIYGSSFGTTLVLDPCGNKVLIPYSKPQGYPTYYTPGTYKYGAASYVPSYEASVYFSKMNEPLQKKAPKPLKPTQIEYSYLPDKNAKKVYYLKPQFISLSSYNPNREPTMYSSKTTGIDTTTPYGCT
jgi:hypothetical protein